jgi:hypothetical protein
MMFLFLLLLLLLSLSDVALKKNEVLRRTDCPFFFSSKNTHKKNFRHESKISISSKKSSLFIKELLRRRK